MMYAAFIGLFLLFYIVIFASLLKTEKFSLFGVLVDIAILTILIIYYFIGKNLEGNDLQSFIRFTIIGSFVFMRFAVKMFWVKPELVNYYIAKEIDENDEEVEQIEVYLQTARLRSVYYFLIAVILFFITRFVVVGGLNENTISQNLFLFFVGILVFLVKLIIDLVQKKKYGVFLFKSLIPLIVIIWIFVTTIILI